MCVIKVINVASKKDLKNFLMLPFRLYKDDIYWVPPIISDQLKFFDKKHNPYFEHSECVLFIAVEDDEVIGRISAHTNINHNKFHNDNKGFFGFFECINDENVSKLLFNEAENWLRMKGCDIISGPYNFSTNDECGLLVDGFACSPFIMMTHNFSYYIDLIEISGFRKKIDMYAWLLKTKEIPRFLDLIGKRFEKNRQYTIRCLNKKNLKNDIKTVFSIYQNAWEKNWGFVPMSKKEFDHLVESLLPLVDPDLVFIAECDGKPAGFSVALPNYNLVLKRLKGKMNLISIIKFLFYKNKIDSLRVITLGVVPEFIGKGIDSLFYYYTWKNGIKKGYYMGEFSWVLETNTMMNKIAEHLGASIHKTYRIYEKEI